MHHIIALIVAGKLACIPAKQHPDQSYAYHAHAHGQYGSYRPYETNLLVIQFQIGHLHNKTLSSQQLQGHEKQPITKSAARLKHLDNDVAHLDCATTSCRPWQLKTMHLVHLPLPHRPNLYPKHNTNQSTSARKLT
jgi:hypothetical protein